MDWMAEAACAGTDVNLFFPPSQRSDRYHEVDGRAQVLAAKAICLSCPVSEQCLAFAMSQRLDDHGIFGGTTPSDRTQIRYPRQRAQVRATTRAGRRVSA